MEQKDTKKDFLTPQRLLPEDFEGTFYFTNWTSEPFIGLWGGKEYVFEPESTSPMIIPEHSPLDIQYIRKKFAWNLAEQEFFKTAEYKKLTALERNSDGTPRLNSMLNSNFYNEKDIVALAYRALEPLPVKKATVRKAAKEDLESKMSIDEKGEHVTTVIGEKTSLVDKAKTA